MKHGDILGNLKERNGGGGQEELYVRKARRSRKRTGGRLRSYSQISLNNSRFHAVSSLLSVCSSIIFLIPRNSWT